MRASCARVAGRDPAVPRPPCSPKHHDEQCDAGAGDHPGQDGRDRLISLNAEDDSILDAALRQGADLPFACKGGVCATCKCKVVQGEVAMAANYSLEADEVAAGYVLSCQALPKSADVVVDFDARGTA